MSLAQDGIGLVQLQQHKRFIESVWSRIEFEDELPLSFDALWRHWQQTRWVSNMWNQAASNHMSTRPNPLWLDNRRLEMSVIGSQWETERQ